jgi:excisionase family DNA binding protein
MSQPHKKLLTYKEAARFLSMPVGTLYAMVHERRVPHLRLSRRLVRFSEAELDEWLDMNEPAQP